MRWAVELSRATVKRMDETTGEIADGPYQQAVKALRQFIRRAGERGASVRDISKSAAGKHPQKMLNDLFVSLTTAGDVFWVENMQTGGRPRSAYVHKDFLAAHGLQGDDPDEGD